MQMASWIASIVFALTLVGAAASSASVRSTNECEQGDELALLQRSIALNERLTKSQHVSVMAQDEAQTAAMQEVDFAILTWNVEHHGFTSNDQQGRNIGARPLQTEDAKHNHGYEETEAQLNKRILKVLTILSQKSWPGLVGFNEIGVLAFDKLLDLLRPPGPPEYHVFTSLRDIRTEIKDDGFGEFEHMSGKVDAQSRPDLQNVYGNVVLVKKDDWDVVHFESVTFPETDTYRANTAIVTHLRSKRSPQTPDLIWIHTHLQYSDHTPGGEVNLKKLAQVTSIQQLVKDYRAKILPNIAISGDLYMQGGHDRFSEAFLTTDIGFHKTNEGGRTQTYDFPKDPDQVLIPDQSDLSMRGNTLVLSGTRTDFSDHAAVLCQLKLTAPEGGVRDPSQMLPLNSAPLGPSVSTAGDDKDVLRQLHAQMDRFQRPAVGADAPIPDAPADAPVAPIPVAPIPVAGHGNSNPLEEDRRELRAMGFNEDQVNDALAFGGDTLGDKANWLMNKQAAPI